MYCNCYNDTRDVTDVKIFWWRGCSILRRPCCELHIIIYCVIYKKHFNSDMGMLSGYVCILVCLAAMRRTKLNVNYVNSVTVSKRTPPL
jgi:hypothetical protein